MAPPETVPSARTTRYFTASVTSANLVLMPRKPASIIQKAAPGPPERDGHGDSADRAESDGAGHRGRKRLEGRRLAGQ